MKIKLYAATNKRTRHTVVLRHLRTTAEQSGDKLEWFSLADDPSCASWSMSPQEISEHDWERLKYVGVWEDEDGRRKHWFHTPEV